MKQRFKYDLHAKVIDITKNYIVVMNYKDQSLRYLKATIMQKLKCKIGKWYYITVGGCNEIIEMVRFKYEED